MRGGVPSATVSSLLPSRDTHGSPPRQPTITPPTSPRPRTAGVFSGDTDQPPKRCKDGHWLFPNATVRRPALSQHMLQPATPGHTVRTR